MLHVVMAKTLRLFHLLTDCLNMLMTQLPSDSDVGLEDEFENVKQWAKDNKMILNITKTKEIVFRRPNPRLSLHPSPLPILLGLVLTERLHFDDHVSAVLKVCSQRMYLLQLLRA